MNRRSVLFLATLLLIAVAPTFAQRSRAELEAEFEELMDGASLIGQFTVDGMNIPVQPESYTVSKIEKLDDGRWLFNATMKYMNNEITLPMPFEVVWAGDTPVITLTNEPITGMEGLFSARVLIYGGAYAGTWAHDAFGGHMWGTIGRLEDEADSAHEPSVGGEAEASAAASAEPTPPE